MVIGEEGRRHKKEKNIFPTRGVNFLPQQQQNYELVSIEQGLDFLLEHFEEEPSLFPRNVSTAATRGGQKPVYDKDRAILFYQGALRHDCRIACYPNYEEMAKNGLITPSYYKPKPSHLFIDLDLSTFRADRRKLDLALKATLRNISRELGGAIPSVIWSGGGYHIHQPLDATIVPVFEQIPEFKRFQDPSISFMRYAARQLTSGKSDPNHNLSFKSCMARIPGSRNSKYTGSDIAQVRIVQCWNGIRARPTRQFMLTDFLIWLVQADLDAKEKLRKRAQKWRPSSSSMPATVVASGIISWIDKLLQTAVDDNRKGLLFWVLAPYLITVRGLDYDQAYSTLDSWLDKCNEVRRLQPDKTSFRYRLRYCLDVAEKQERRPIRFDTFREYYPDVYKALAFGGGA